MNMSGEKSSIWGTKLDATHKSFTFDPETELEVPLSILSLNLKQAILGAEANVGDDCEVQMECTGMTGKIVTPIAHLEAGKFRQCPLDFNFTDTPVKFTLVRGEGPVYLNGIQHCCPMDDMDEEEEEDEEGLEGFYDESPDKLNPSKKQKLMEELDEDEALKKKGKTPPKDKKVLAQKKK